MMKPAHHPTITRTKAIAALSVAVAADLIQLALGPFGWTSFDEFIDVVAMVTTWSLLGFHPLLLPTFILECVPIVDMLPTWTGCVGAVLLLRKGQQTRPAPNHANETDAKVIDV
jgi:hypothetical protein